MSSPPGPEVSETLLILTVIMLAFDLLFISFAIYLVIKWYRLIWWMKCIKRRQGYIKGEDFVEMFHGAPLQNVKEALICSAILQNKHWDSKWSLAEE